MSRPREVDLTTFTMVTETDLNETTMIEDTSGRRLKTLETALDVVDFVQDREGASIVEIAEQIDLAKSTVHGYVKTLQRRGYLVREGDTYHVGMEFLDKGGHTRRRKSGYDLVIDKVDDLADRTGERAQFIVEENGYGYYVHTAIGENAVHVDARIGKKMPLHASSAGKAILAELPADAVERIVDRWGMEPMTNRTITDRRELERELDEIRSNGYAVSDQESIDGLRAVGVAISPGTEPVGAISLSGPAYRMIDDRFDEVIDLILGVVNEIELELEYH